MNSWRRGGVGGQFGPQMDGAAVSNMGPSGGGLTCLPTYHSLMPIDKWVVRRWLWLRKEKRGRRQGNWDGTSCSDTEPESLQLSAAGDASVKRCEGRREFGLFACACVERFT